MGEQQCEPLKNLDELFSWQASDSDWSTLVTPLTPRSDYCYAGKDLHCHKNTHKPVRLLKSSAPKTLICHDMMGGYLDDKFVHGSAYTGQYLFYHWSGVDIFVYFSHHFVTIPPLMWINAAHNHGVQVLGTIITEHKDGIALWNRIFADENAQNRLVDQLVAIQKHYQFDGYLVNIENEIDFDHLPKLVNFLRDLKSKLDGIVIWYDAVSFVHGKLKWQDELNEHNRLAFAICDGVFLNYNWDPAKLQKSLLNAGTRLHDVYVGIDVFPRGRVDAGGFYTKDALATVRSFGLSAAIFGFGWTHEVEAKSSNSSFFAVEKKFWTKLYPHLYFHCPSSLPFKTDYNIGFGRDPQLNTLLYDLSLQSFKLSLQSCLNEKEKSCFHFALDDSFTGSGCLLLNAIKNETEIHKLMMCNFPCSEESPLKLSISAKTVSEFRPFELLLHVENEISNNFTIILFFSKENEFLSNQVDYSCSVVHSEKINQAKIIQTNPNQWVTNIFPLTFFGTITEIIARIEVPTMIGSLSLE